MTGTSVKISLASMGVCAGFGGFGEAELEAGIISLSASPSTIAYAPTFGNGGYLTLNPLSGTFFQYNDGLGKSIFGVGFQWANVAQGQRIDKNTPFTLGIGVGVSSAGDKLFAFRQGNHYGWIKENLGGLGGNITFISGAYNDGTDLNNDFIDAGTLNGGGGGAAVPEPGTTGLMGLAALAAGATAIRRRRAATAAATVDSAS